MSEVLIAASDNLTHIHPVTAKDWPETLEKSSALAQALAAQTEFKAKTGQVLVVPDVAGEKVVAFGLGDADDPALYRALPAKLPPGDYKIHGGGDPMRIALSWALGAYRFDRYKQKHGEPWPRLIVEDAAIRAQAIMIAHACALARDMINTPANDMGPLQIESIAREMAHKAKAKIAVVTGDDLHTENYPAVHAVGRAAIPDRAPRMIELTWNGSGGKSGPVVVIIGKGVVFDTGGLDIKPSAGMRLMKKDMGGAAHALALGRMVMEAGLKVRLTVLVPVAENAISGDAMRPGDVIGSRKGLTIEVGNTDAEGRLILADALARADELKPDLTIDFATLTGAARMALGPQLPPLFTDDDALAAELLAAGLAEADPMWRLPLYAGYAEALDSDIADIANDPAGWAQAGAVTAALFLKRFAPSTGSWVHFDIMAWNPKARPGHPTGGEAQALRAVFAVLKSRYS